MICQESAALLFFSHWTEVELNTQSNIIKKLRYKTDVENCAVWDVYPLRWSFLCHVSLHCKRLRPFYLSGCGGFCVPAITNGSQASVQSAGPRWKQCYWTTQSNENKYREDLYILLCSSLTLYIFKCNNLDAAINNSVNLSQCFRYFILLCRIGFQKNPWYTSPTEHP